VYDVALYGHLTLDRIFNDFKKDCTIGSIGNVWKQLISLDPKLKIYIEPTDIGEAMILVNQRNNERSSVANLSLLHKDPVVKKSNWSHIMYINELNNIDYIKDIDDGIVSADICRGKKIKDVSILKNIDFLFLSDEDEFMKPIELCKMLRKGLILHHPLGSTYYDSKGNKQEFETKFVDNVNVLGCGDMLAAGFINFYLKSKNISSALKNAHQSVYNILENQRQGLNGNS